MKTHIIAETNSKLLLIITNEINTLTNPIEILSIKVIEITEDDNRLTKYLGSNLKEALTIYNNLN